MNLLRKMFPLVAVVLLTRGAIAGGHDKGCCPTCGDKVCTPTRVEKKVKKYHYEVECKDICIPGITLPWSKNCTPKSGRVIRVKVFKKKEFECKACGCKWEIRGNGSKGKGAADAKRGVPTPAPQPPAASAVKPSLGRPKFGQLSPRGPLPVLSNSKSKQMTVRLPSTKVSKKRSSGRRSTFQRLFFPERTVSYYQRTKK